MEALSPNGRAPLPAGTGTRGRRSETRPRHRRRPRPADGECGTWRKIPCRWHPWPFQVPRGLRESFGRSSQTKPAARERRPVRATAACCISATREGNVLGAPLRSRGTYEAFETPSSKVVLFPDGGIRVRLTGGRTPRGPGRTKHPGPPVPSGTRWPTRTGTTHTNERRKKSGRSTWVWLRSVRPPKSSSAPGAHPPAPGIEGSVRIAPVSDERSIATGRSPSVKGE